MSDFEDKVRPAGPLKTATFAGRFNSTQVSTKPDQAQTCNGGLCTCTSDTECSAPETCQGAPSGHCASKLDFTQFWDETKGRYEVPVPLADDGNEVLFTVNGTSTSCARFQFLNQRPQSWPPGGQSMSSLDSAIDCARYYGGGRIRVELAQGIQSGIVSISNFNNQPNTPGDKWLVIEPSSVAPLQTVAVTWDPSVNWLHQKAQLSIFASHRVMIDGLEIHHTPADDSSNSGMYGVKISGDASSGQSDSVIIQRSNIHDHYLNGIVYENSSSNIMLFGNEVSKTSLINLDERLVNDPVLCSQQRWSGGIAGGSQLDTSTRWVHLRNNAVHDVWGECLIVSNTKETEAVGNTIHHCYSVGLYVDGGESFTLNGNYIYEPDSRFQKTRQRNSSGVCVALSSPRRASGIQIAHENPGYPIPSGDAINNIVDACGDGIHLNRVDNHLCYTKVHIEHNTIVNGRGISVAADEPDANACPQSVDNRLVNNLLRKSVAGTARIDPYVNNVFPDWAIEGNLFPDGVPVGNLAGKSVSATNIPGAAELRGPTYEVDDEAGVTPTSYTPLPGSSAYNSTSNTDNVTHDFFGKLRDPNRPTKGAVEGQRNLKIFVDAYAVGGSTAAQNCAFGSGLPGNEAANPISASPSGGDPLAYVLSCMGTATYPDAVVEIVVGCSGTGPCVYSSDYTLPNVQSPSEGPIHTLRPSRDGVVSLRPQNRVRIGGGWRFAGFEVDGRAVVSSGASEDDALVYLEGSYITFERNWVHDGRKTCVNVASYADPLTIAGDGVLILRNRIEGCYDDSDAVAYVHSGGFTTQESMRPRHCILDHFASVTIEENTLRRCESDAVAIVNYVNGSGKFPQDAREDSIVIRGNRIESPCEATRGGSRSIGEVGIDLRRAYFARVEDNYIWGYRGHPAANETDSCAGTGIASAGTLAASGVAIYVHGGGNYRVMSNEIANSSGGVALSADPYAGTPFADPVVTGNAIHDLRGLALEEGTGQNAVETRGFGVKAAIDDTRVRSRIQRNTLVNIPGQVLALSPSSVNDGNLIAYAAQCGISSGENWVYSAPTATRTSDGGLSARYTGADDLVSGTVHPSTADACGVGLPPLLSYQDPFQGDNDYRVLPAGVARNSSTSTATPNDSYMPVNVGPSDFGSTETGDSTKALFIRDDATAPCGELEVCFIPNYSTSPDIGYLAGGPYVPLVDVSEGVLPVLTEVWRNYGEAPKRLRVPPSVLVRLRSANDAIPDGTTFHLRLWAASSKLVGFAATSAFPSEYVKIFDDNVVWNAQLSPQVGAGRWQLVDTAITGASTRVNVYRIYLPTSFTDAVRGPYRFVVDAGLLQAPFDFSPQLFTAVWRSNNRAMMDVQRSRFRMRRGVHNFKFSRSGLRLEATGVQLNRPVFVYVPDDPSQPYVDDDSMPFPPTRGRLDRVEGTTAIELPDPNLGSNLVQVLVDNDSSPTEGEAVTLTVSGDGVEEPVTRIELDHPGEWWSDSMEFPADWAATGYWRSIDEIYDACGRASTGRMSFGFTTSSCTYAGTLTQGTLTSGYIAIPDTATQATLSFLQWSETEQTPGFDIRRVRVVPLTGTGRVIAEWSGSDAGSRDEWLETNLDLSDFRGQSVRIEFEFDSVDQFFNDYAGWHVDDVEVRWTR